MQKSNKRKLFLEMQAWQKRGGLEENTNQVQIGLVGEKDGGKRRV